MRVPYPLRRKGPTGTIPYPWQHSPCLARLLPSTCASSLSLFLSALSATVSGVIGWPCILSLLVTAQACASSWFSNAASACVRAPLCNCVCVLCVRNPRRWEGIFIPDPTTRRKRLGVTGCKYSRVSTWSRYRNANVAGRRWRIYRISPLSFYFLTEEEESCFLFQRTEETKQRVIDQRCNLKIGNVHREKIFLRIFSFLFLCSHDFENLRISHVRRIRRSEN